MPLPDSGNVEDYTEEEMTQLLAMDKGEMTKLQKAAYARYNFKKTRGEPIVFRQTGAAVAPAAPPPSPPPAAAAPAAAGTAPEAPALPPEVAALATKDPATLTKEERIALAKAKSQAARAQMAAKTAASGAPGAAPAAAEAAGTPAQDPGRKARDLAGKFLVAQRVKKRFGDKVVDLQMQAMKTPIVVVQPETLEDALRFARDELSMNHLACITAADYPPERIEVLYNVYSYELKQGLALKVKLPRSGARPGTLPSVPTAVPVYKGADWFEREVYDMFGVDFEGHPQMTRLLLPEGWTGHPLRKDYDVTKPQYIGMDADGNDVVSFNPEDGW